MQKQRQILIIDGQGGKLGQQLITALKAAVPDCELIAVGTNGIASANMMKASPLYAATGENAVIVACRTADIIVGPIGIVIADALHGELTPRMALAVAQSQAHRVLIPVNRCNNYVAGLRAQTVAELLQDALKHVQELIASYS